jgi:hypothetical protein
MVNFLWNSFLLLARGGAIVPGMGHARASSDGKRGVASGYLNHKLKILPN